MTVGSDATGDVYYRDASGHLERLGASTDGYVLTTGGAGTVPAWEALPSSGISWDGSTANGVATYKDGDEATVESTLTFASPVLTVGASATAEVRLLGSGDNSVKGLSIYSGASSAERYDLGLNWGGGMVEYDAKTGMGHDFQISGTSSLMLTAAGDLGLGTMAPLNYFNNGANAVGMTILNSDNSASTKSAELALSAAASNTQCTIGFYETTTLKAQILSNLNNDGELFFKTNGDNTRMLIDSSGDVGIGTTDPDAAAPTGSSSPKILKIDGGEGVDAALQIVGHDNSHGLDLWTDVSTGDAYIDQRGDHANYDLRFRTRTTGTPIDAMIISGAGDVSIGDGLPTYRLDVYDNVADRVAEITNESASGHLLALTYRNVAPDDNTQWFLKCDDSSANRMRVWSDGDVVTADAATLTSDQRLKTNIVDASDKLADVMKLQVRNYEWTPEYHPNKVGEKKIGFIAQELETVFPALISEHDIAADNSIEEELYTADDDTQYYVDGDDIPDGKAVGDVKAESQIPEGKAVGDVKVEAKDHEPTMRKSYKNAFVPILVKALQEVTTRLEAAEAKITALESA